MRSYNLIDLKVSLPFYKMKELCHENVPCGNFSEENRGMWLGLSCDYLNLSCRKLQYSGRFRRTI